MKIGLFDSGLGGLIVAHSLIQALPQYDYLYLGDTTRVPYGNRSQDTIYDFTLEAIKYLMARDCGLIIVACNTASAEALRRIQQEYLPQHYPNRRVLGVLIPAAEAAVRATKSGRIGVLATTGTINSGAFDREIHKLAPKAQIITSPAPLLVPLVENNALKWAGPILDEYLEPLTHIDTLILGCTHYPYLKHLIRKRVGEGVNIISQDEVVAPKLAGYLKRHPEIEQSLSQNGRHTLQLTDLSQDAQAVAKRLFNQPIELELAKLK